MELRRTAPRGESSAPVGPRPRSPATDDLVEANGNRLELGPRLNWACPLTARRELLLLDRFDRPLVQAVLPDFGHQQHCSFVLRLAGPSGIVGLETSEQAWAGATIADEK